LSGSQISRISRSANSRVSWLFMVQASFEPHRCDSMHSLRLVRWRNQFNLKANGWQISCRPYKARARTNPLPPYRSA
jgi:hypothetical protein